MNKQTVRKATMIFTNLRADRSPAKLG